MPFSKVVILPYKMGSQSAKRLARQLSALLTKRVRRVRMEGNYYPNRNSLIINYGQSQVPFWGRFSQQYQWLNPPEAVARAANKLTTVNYFKAFGISTPEFTTQQEIAQQWLDEGKIVVCRTLLNAHSGRGIIVVSTNMMPPRLIGGAERLPLAPLYVLYKKKRKEFRVHVFRGNVIDVSEKRKRRGVEREDGYIRNLANGWVFCRDNIVEPEGLRPLAVAATNVLGLGFGAVDIIWNEKENQCYALEVNTAPGLEGTTLVNYARACWDWIRASV